MNMDYRWAIAGFTLTLAVAAIGTSATAQEVSSGPVAVPITTIPQKFDDVYFGNDHIYWQNRTIPRQLDYLFGLGGIVRSGYPENEITRDGRELHQLYQEVMSRQMASGPVLRTADLPNPFSQSLQSLPTYGEASRVLPVQPPILEPAAPATNPQPRGPVPALW